MIKSLKAYFPECIECLEPSGALLCETCFSKLRFRRACVECGRLGLDENLNKCIPCEQKSRPWDNLSAAFLFEGGIRDWIHDIKDDSKPERIFELTLDMLPKIEGADFLLPVSSDPRHIRRRGYNVAEILGQRLSKLLKIPVLETPIERFAFLSAQKDLDELNRKKFLNRMLRLRSDVRDLTGLNILLVDDVMTTGASLDLHASLLLSVGARVNAFCLARTPRYT